MTTPQDETSLSIAHLSSPQVDRGGDFIYRVEQPHFALASLPGVQVVELSTLSRHREKILTEADILIINLIGDPDLLPVIRERKRAGKLTVYEINDYFLGLQPWNPVYYFFRDPENRACILQLIEKSDCVQVTCRELARRFQNYNPNIAIFENQMREVGSLNKPESPLTIGWGGSHGHLDDMRQAAPHLIRWFKEHPETRLSIMGSRQIYSLFDELDPQQKRYTPPGSLEDFFGFLRTLHIGLAPLIPTDYNLCRSDVKFLEYGAFGVAPVCPDLETYHSVKNGETGLLFHGMEEIPVILNRLVDDPALRKRIARNAHAYVRNERMEAQHAGDRLEFYRKQLAKIQVRTVSRTGPLPWVNRLPEARRKGNSDYTTLLYTPVEENLHNGLVHQFQHNRIPEAVRCFRLALDACPDFYLAALYLGNALESSAPEEADLAYEQALRLNPKSCVAAILLGRIQQKNGDPRKAKESFQRALEIAPDDARAWMHLGALLQESREIDSALEHYRNSLRENPYYSPSLTRLGALLFELGRLEEAGEIFKRALTLNPESGVDCFFSGNIAARQGKIDAALLWYRRAVELQPDLAAAHANLSRLYRATGKSAEAEAAKNEAIRLQPGLKGKI